MADQITAFDHGQACGKNPGRTAEYKAVDQMKPCGHFPLQQKK